MHNGGASQLGQSSSAHENLSINTTQGLGDAVRDSSSVIPSTFVCMDCAGTRSTEYTNSQPSAKVQELALWDDFCVQSG